MRPLPLVLVLLFLSWLTSQTEAQFKDQGFGVGLQGGVNLGMIDGAADKMMFAIRPYARYPMAKKILFGEFGLTLGRIRAEASEGREVTRRSWPISTTGFCSAPPWKSGIPTSSPASAHRISM
jgi:hypothetical protein